MLRNVLAGLILISALDVSSASAMSFTLDSPALTVVRPSSGFVTVDFTGTVTIDDGFELTSATLGGLSTASGEVLDAIFPSIPFFPVLTGTLTGTMFTVRVADTDALGLYAFFNFPDPAFVTFSECPVGGGLCNSATVNYSVDIVDAAVPEPATVLLLGTGVAGLAARRRKRER